MPNYSENQLMPASAFNAAILGGRNIFKNVTVTGNISLNGRHFRRGLSLTRVLFLGDLDLGNISADTDIVIVDVFVDGYLTIAPNAGHILAELKKIDTFHETN